MSIVTWVNNPPMNTYSNLPKLSSPAPEFSLKKENKDTVTLGTYKGKKIVINTLPTVDNDSCRKCVEKFNSLAAAHQDTVFLCVTIDNFYAFAKYSKILPNVTLLSTHGREKFGQDYGVQIQDGKLEGQLARSVIVVNENGVVIHSELVSEITAEPDYNACTAALLGKPGASSNNLKTEMDGASSTATTVNTSNASGKIVTFSTEASAATMPKATHTIEPPTTAAIADAYLSGVRMHASSKAVTSSSTAGDAFATNVKLFK